MLFRTIWLGLKLARAYWKRRKYSRHVRERAAKVRAAFERGDIYFPGHEHGTKGPWDG